MTFRDRQPTGFALAAVGLIAIFLLLSFSESRLKSPTSDEPPHLAAGLSYIATGLVRGNPQHPPLLKELSGLSLLMGGIRWPQSLEAERFRRGDVALGAQPEWRIGKQIIAADGAAPVMFWARLPFPFVAAMLGVLLFVWGRQMLGGAAALGGLFLYILDPTILAHSFLVTMDVGMAAFTLLLLVAVWRYAQRPTGRRLVLCGLSLGAALGAKFSALLMLPVVGGLLLAAVIWPPTQCPNRGTGAIVATATWAHHGLTRNVLARMGAFLAMCLIAVVIIQALYLFPADLLAYYHGFKRVNADHDPTYPFYMAGELGGPFASYFVVAYLLKEPIASIVLAAIGLITLLRGRTIFIAKLFLLLPPAVLFLGHTIWADDIGIRYIMGVLPFAHLLGGLGLAVLLGATAKWVRATGVLLCLWVVVAAAGIYPDGLSYFNESACLLADPGLLGLDGGARCGPQWLDDSNVDWGQGMKQLKTWLDTHEPGRTVRLADPFAVPAAAYGIPLQAADLSELVGKPLPALYVVSAHLVARLPVVASSSGWLRRTPARIIGHALYVYDLAPQAVESR